MLFEMAPYKASGIDRMHAGFYQSMWNIVGRKLCNFVENFLGHDYLPQGTNDTIITLIPKVKLCNVAKSLAQPRPISLCNVGYKVITKTMTNRMKQFMATVK